MGQDFVANDRDRWASAENRAVADLDRTELDLLFGLKHARAAVHIFSPPEERMLRTDPPIRLLVTDPARAPPPSRTLRFCRFPD